MAQGYWYFNRTFVTAEPYSTRTKAPGIRPCLPQHEDGWHRLDTLRFRSHPCFRTVHEAPLHPERGVSVWCVDNGRFLITARTGLNFIELFADGNEFATTWLEYSDRDGAGEGLARHVELTESDLRVRLPPEKKNCKKLKMAVHSLGGVKAEIEDVTNAAKKVRMPKGMTGYWGPKYGSSQMGGSMAMQLVMSSISEKKKLLVLVRVYHEQAVYGVEIVYEDGSVELFGKRGGRPKDVNFGMWRCRRFYRIY
jgi:Putative peptidase family